jgi:ABC-type transporter MlaC component
MIDVKLNSVQINYKKIWEKSSGGFRIFPVVEEGVLILTSIHNFFNPSYIPTPSQ